MLSEGYLIQILEVLLPMILAAIGGRSLACRSANAKLRCAAQKGHCFRWVNRKERIGRVGASTFKCSKCGLSYSVDDTELTGEHRGMIAQVVDPPSIRVPENIVPPKGASTDEIDNDWE
jgi:hypothetical protein